MIHIFTTGGTIEGYEYTKEEDKPINTGASIEDFLKSISFSKEYKISRVLQKDSRLITEEDRDIIYDRILNTKSNKILITHGTYTMVETAKHLGKRNIDKTIVLVGSFILGTNDNTDAPANLEFAISSLNKLAVGVYIAMHEQVFHWENVRKNLQTNKFQSNED